MKAIYLAMLLLAGTGDMREWAESGRIVGIADTPSQRVNPPGAISPGLPPALSFRVFDAGDRGRLSEVGLMTDDAGH